MSKRIAGLALTALLGFSAPALAEDDPPVDCDNAQNQSEMTQCAYDDLAGADDALNAQYKKTRAVMAAMDADYDADQRGAEKALVNAQRAWIDYRDNHCTAYAYQAHLGTMEPMLDAGCRAELTRTRTTELKELGQGQDN